MYLTVVLAIRNDNYGGNQKEVFQKVIDYYSYLQAEFIDLFEICLVELNPPKDRKRQLEEFDFSKLKKYSIVTVPDNIAEEISNKPFVEYIAKNVGIRNAK